MRRLRIFLELMNHWWLELKVLSRYRDSRKLRESRSFAPTMWASHSTPPISIDNSCLKGVRDHYFADLQERFFYRRNWEMPLSSWWSSQSPRRTRGLPSLGGFVAEFLVFVKPFGDLINIFLLLPRFQCFLCLNPKMILELQWETPTSLTFENFSEK